MDSMKMVKLEEQDRKELSQSIFEVDASMELYQTAAKDLSMPADRVAILFEFYMKSLKEHKYLWANILNKYMGEDDASTYRNLYRYDVQKNVIFMLQPEGCAICKGRE